MYEKKETLFRSPLEVLEFFRPHYIQLASLLKYAIENLYYSVLARDSNALYWCNSIEESEKCGVSKSLTAARMTNAPSCVAI